MKITHSSGEDYDLSPGLVLEIERTNPFFNDYGEQSLPVTLPPTARNRRLLLYPDDIRGLTKASQRAEAMVSHGAYAVRCRQAILSGNKNTGIETSFYLNTGAFYEKIKDVQLSSIFQDKTIKFGSVESAIQFCKSLYTSYDERFACFPVRIKGYTLNAYDTWSNFQSAPDLYHANERSITVDDKQIFLNPGYYITPFVRAVHLLKEIFLHFGYSLKDNFFTKTEPFKSMVLLNNTIDTIVKSEIRYSHIIPDCTVSTILDMYRGLFDCEFIPDEVNKSITIKRFSEAFEEKAEIDITDMITKNYTVEHPQEFKQIQLSAKYIESEEINSDLQSSFALTMRESVGGSFNNVAELLKKYPDAEYNPATGTFTRKGFKGVYYVEQTVGSLLCDYYAGGDLGIEKKEIDCLIGKMGTYLHVDKLSFVGKSLEVYVGEGRDLNSTIVMDSAINEAELTATSEVSYKELSVIPCFVYRDKSGYADFGTVLNYDVNENKLWNYSLAFNGPDGLFERFYRTRDTLLRNSLLKISAEILLDEISKFSLSEHKKVLIDGQEVFPNIIHFSVNKFSPSECSFYTTKLYTPISIAPNKDDKLEPHPYRWNLRADPLDGRYSHWEYVNEPSTIFYAPPTAEQYIRGGRYHEMSYPIKYWNDDPGKKVDGFCTYWLEAKLR